MRTSLLSLFSLVVLVAAGEAHRVPYKIKQRIDHPLGWIKHAPAPPHHLIKLKIAFPRPRFSELEKHLLEISDPTHRRYGDFLSKEETEALMAPHPESLDAVNGWLSSHGIKEEHLYRSPAMDWITVHIPIALAEKMLDAKYDIYTHSQSGESIVRTTSYSLPEHVHEHVELIQPTTMFSRARAMGNLIHETSPVITVDTSEGPAGSLTDTGCNNTITIQCLKHLYNVGEYKTSATNGNRFAVTAYLEQYANNQDLQKFYQQQVPDAYGSSYTFVSVNGGLNNQSVDAAGSEANLDTQYGFGLTHPTEAILYSTGGSPPFISDNVTRTDTNEPYLEWLDYMLSQECPPQTISTSYGDDEQTVPYDYARRVCDGFAILGVRGVSILVASGDFGVGYVFYRDPGSLEKCFSNDGTNKSMFIPDFPTSCPYATTVGATKNIPEVAAKFSGGGFSNYFPRPAYQDMAVSKYLNNLAPDTYKGLFNPNGRGYPDVAAQGVNFTIFLEGKKAKITGTSCSTPTFAALISMLNDARINAGKKPLGFLNPWLYATGYTALNDITEGNNPNCGTDGFNATKGWDPVTGLGTPDFEKLLRLALYT